MILIYILALHTQSDLWYMSASSLISWLYLLLCFASQMHCLYLPSQSKWVQFIKLVHNLLSPPQHPWYNQYYVELISTAETSPKATLAALQLFNELKRCCCAMKIPAALKVIQEESRQVPLGCKRGYGFLPITVPIPFDILSTLSFPPVLGNSSCHNRAHLLYCLSLHGGRSMRMEKTLVGNFQLALAMRQRWVSAWPGSQGSPPLGSHCLVQSTHS